MCGSPVLSKVPSFKACSWSEYSFGCCACLQGIYTYVVSAFPAHLTSSRNYLSRGDSGELLLLRILEIITFIPEGLVSDLQAFPQRWTQWQPTAVRLTSARQRKRKSLKKKAGICNSSRWGKLWVLSVRVLECFSFTLSIYECSSSVFIFSLVPSSWYCFWTDQVILKRHHTNWVDRNKTDQLFVCLHPLQELTPWFIKEHSVVLHLLLSFFLQDAMLPLSFRQLHLDFRGKTDQHHVISYLWTHFIAAVVYWYSTKKRVLLTQSVWGDIWYS